MDNLETIYRVTIDHYIVCEDFDYDRAKQSLDWTKYLNSNNDIPSVIKLKTLKIPIDSI